MILTPDGKINLERREFSQQQQEFFDHFNEALKDLMLSCPDTSIPNKEISKKLTAFAKSIRALRERYFQDVKHESLRQALSGHNKGDVYSRFPGRVSSKQGSSRAPTVWLPLSQGAQLAKILIDHGEAKKKQKARQKRKPATPKNRTAKKSE